MSDHLPTWTVPPSSIEHRRGVSVHLRHSSDPAVRGRAVIELCFAAELDVTADVQQPARALWADLLRQRLADFLAADPDAQRFARLRVETEAADRRVQQAQAKLQKLADKRTGLVTEAAAGLAPALAKLDAQLAAARADLDQAEAGRGALAAPLAEARRTAEAGLQAAARDIMGTLRTALAHQQRETLAAVADRCSEELLTLTRTDHAIRSTGGGQGLALLGKADALQTSLLDALQPTPSAEDVVTEHTRVETNV